MHKAPLLFLFCLGLSLLAPAPARAGEPPKDFRALWVTRWDYRTPIDVKRAVEEASAAGFTDILWQVRGQCDAFYKSDLEPWGRELFRDLPPGTKEPTFDPLALVVQEAHAHNLRIHAWFNVMPLWKSTKPPTDPKHPFNAHPEWRLRDAKGEPQALKEDYVIVNPILPEVHDHIVAVAKDLMSRYALDGLHLDYVRFVSETMKDSAAYPADPRSLELFKKATGRAGVTSQEDQAAFRDYKRDRITTLVRRLRREAVASRQGAVLTAAVWRRPDLGRDTFLQDGAAWVKEGTLDRAIPMIYTDDDTQYKSDLTAWIEALGKTNLTKLSPGIGNYKHNPPQTPRQITTAREMGTQGFAAFAYSSLFESVDPNQDKNAKSINERTERRKALTDFLKSQSK